MPRSKGLAVLTGLLACAAAAGLIVFWPAVRQILPLSSPAQPVDVPRIAARVDRDADGVLDADDLVAGARQEALRKTKYSAAYYAGGYPPEGEGACTDVVWRAFRAAGYDLKAMIDADIRANPQAYPGVRGGRPDPNIDFRRVSNLVAFFRRHAISLTTDVRPGDADNLKEWQGGDIVVYAPPLEHIGIVSDRRRPDGVPLLIHNAGPHAVEADALTSWPTRITYHFRYAPEAR